MCRKSIWFIKRDKSLEVALQPLNVHLYKNLLFYSCSICKTVLIILLMFCDNKIYLVYQFKALNLIFFSCSGLKITVVVENIIKIDFEQKYFFKKLTKLAFYWKVDCQNSGTNCSWLGIKFGLWVKKEGIVC